MGIAEFVGAFFNATPVVRRIWRWLLERQMEVSVIGPMFLGQRENITLSVAIEEPPEGEIKMPPSIVARFALRLVNHRAERKERIIGASLALKKRRLFFWRDSLITIPVHQQGQRTLIGPPISNIELAPLCAPVEVQCVAFHTMDESIRQQAPRRFEMCLVLEMVGPIRRLERKVMDFVRPRHHAALK